MLGYIKGVDQPVSDFFEEYKTGFGASLTVGDLASMSSGMKWNEKYYSIINIGMCSTVLPYYFAVVFEVQRRKTGKRKERPREVSRWRTQGRASDHGFPCFRAFFNPPFKVLKKKVSVVHLPG